MSDGDPRAAARSRLYHGGDPAAIRDIAGAFDGPWLDLSTGINPWPYPFEAPPPTAWTRLPDRALDARLRAAAASAYGAPSAESVAAAPGSQSLIQLLPRLRPPCRVRVLGPTYAEHRARWAAAGHDARTVTAPEALADGDVAVIVNPNNPDGRTLAPAALADLADRLAARGGWLVVDEAFADLDPEASAASRSGRPGLIVLRSFGKFYGLAGLRLGFALAEPELARRIREEFGPWAVAGPAAWIGAQALADAAWAAGMRPRLRRQADALDALLAAFDRPVVGGTALFRLVRTPGAHDLFRALARRGVFVRHFPERPDRLRFGLPGDQEGFDRLRRALAAAAAGR